MKKYKNLFIILGVIGLLIILSISGRFLNKNKASEMILFFGDTCPHCKNVDEYITTNNIKSRLNFQELEVYNNKTNAALLSAKAKDCGLDISQGVGVPFFFDGQNCILGDQPIIDFLKTK
jgi:hypothetical protein